MMIELGSGATKKKERAMRTAAETGRADVEAGVAEERGRTSRSSSEADEAEMDWRRALQRAAAKTRSLEGGEGGRSLEEELRDHEPGCLCCCCRGVCSDSHERRVAERRKEQQLADAVAERDPIHSPRKGSFGGRHRTVAEHEALVPHGKRLTPMVFQDICKVMLATFCLTLLVFVAFGSIDLASFASIQRGSLRGQLMHHAFTHESFWDLEENRSGTILARNVSRKPWARPPPLAELQQDQVFVLDCKDSIAVGATVGLMNRQGPKADCAKTWIEHLGFIPVAVGQRQFIQHATDRGMFKGKVLYEAGNPISENLALSVAGIYDLLPVPETSAQQPIGDLPVRFDFGKSATQGPTGGSFASFADATAWTVANILKDSNRELFVYRPPRTKLMPFITMERAVAVFVDGIATKCLEYSLTPTDVLAEVVAKANGLKPFLDLTSSSHWDVSERPLTMYGYSAGIFESTGFCTRNKTMGVAASDIADSIGFLKSVQRQHPELEISHAHPAQQNRNFDQDVKFDPSKRYVTHVVSDGDNLSLLGNTLKYLEERHELCKARTKPCAPVTWTISGQLQTVSPALRKMYELVNAPGSTDSFMLPPSGASYFYPAASRDVHGRTQQRDWTVRNAEAMDVEATIVWDFFFHFFAKSHKDFVKSFVGSQIKAVFWSAAPWLLSPNEKIPFAKLGYTSDQVLRDEEGSKNGVIVFQELTRWGSTTGPDSNDGKHLSAEVMAQLIASQPAGSLNFVYDISWGPGLQPRDFLAYADLVEANHPEVELVDHRTLIRLACQKHGLDCDL